MSYQPPYTLTPAIVSLIADIAEALGRLSLLREQSLRLRRVNRIRSIRGSLAIEGNTLSEEQITAILDGKPVIAPPREVQEARNALAAYEQMLGWQPQREADLLQAHQVMMQGLIDEAGHYRGGGVGVMHGKQVIHMAPPAKRVPQLMNNLLAWLAQSEEHALIRSAVFHYEFEFIHPFADGNGRMGRLWQTLILSRWNPLLADLPVENIVHAHQAAYYQSLQQSSEQGDSAPFIEFILGMIRTACEPDTPQVAPEVTPQVRRLLAQMSDQMSRNDLMQALALKDPKHFRKDYLLPALGDGLIEMTQPDSPSSPTQKYRLTDRGRSQIKRGKQ